MIMSPINKSATRGNSAYPQHGFPRTWSALDLADAIPLKLSERLTLGLVAFAPAEAAANSPFAMPAPRAWRRRYLAGAELPAFVRVR
jgi:hypothetical protein